MSKKMILIIPVLILLKLAYCQLENTDDEETMLNKTKVLACIALSKARLVQDGVKQIIILCFRRS